MNPDLLRPVPHISGYLKANCEMWGVKIVLALIQMPDQMVHCIALSHHLEPEESKSVPAGKVDRLIRDLDKIPMTDDKTLREVDRQINRLIGIKAEKLKLEQDCSDLDAELDALVSYRKQTTRPGGAIRHFYSVEQKEYQRHRAAVSRLLEKAKKECPEAYHYIKSHLLTGTWFFWSSDELTPRKISLLSHSCENGYFSLPEGHARC
jgi:hypothetical protein